MRFLRFLFLLLLFLRLAAFWSGRPTWENGDKIRIHGFLREVPTHNFNKTFFKLDGLEVYWSNKNKIKLKQFQFLTVEGRVKLKTTARGENFWQLVAEKVESKEVWLKSRVLRGLNEFVGRVKQGFKKVLPAESAGILNGVMFGEIEGMSADFVADLKITGLLHLFAASGVNLVIWCGLIQIAAELIVNKRQAIFAAWLGSAIYSAITGFSASILRASAMFFFSTLAKVVGRPSKPLNNLSLAVGLLLFWWPYLLILPGFWLSVAATWGLAANFPVKNKAWGEMVNPFFATGAMAIFAFNQINLLSPVFTFLTGWGMEIVMALGIFFTPLAYFQADFRLPASIFLLPFLKYLEQTVKLFSSVKLGLLKVGNQEKTIFFLIFILVFWLFFLIRKEQEDRRDEN